MLSMRDEMNVFVNQPTYFCFRTNRPSAAVRLAAFAHTEHVFVVVVVLIVVLLSLCNLAFLALNHKCLFNDDSHVDGNTLAPDECFLCFLNIHPCVDLFLLNGQRHKP